jgi:hypothetical protein
MVGEKFGRALLEKMGWTAGTGLGAKRDGCIEPLAVKSRPEKLGVGAERRRDFRDAWWEKAFEDAYGKAADHAGEDKLLRACEGRRCRPHGAAKLARIAKQDASAKAISGRETSASSSASEEADDQIIKLRACNVSVDFVLKESHTQDDRKARTKRKRQRETCSSIALECSSAAGQSNGNCSTLGLKIAGRGDDARVDKLMHRKLKKNAEKSKAKKAKRAKSEKPKTEDKRSALARRRKEIAEPSDRRAKTELSSPCMDLKTSTGRVSKHSRKP